MIASFLILVFISKLDRHTIVQSLKYSSLDLGIKSTTITVLSFQIFYELVNFINLFDTHKKTFSSIVNFHMKEYCIAYFLSFERNPIKKQLTFVPALYNYITNTQMIVLMLQKYFTVLSNKAHLKDFF